MREMILNHASIVSPDRATGTKWLHDVAKGMATLVMEGSVASSLRSYLHPSQIKCVSDWTLWDAYLDLRHLGKREEYLFLLRLATKVPLLSDVDPNLRDRFRSSEHRTLAAQDGEPLVFCAISDSIAIGFPSATIWDTSELEVSFRELLPDITFQEVSETIDNLTRSVHARQISERKRTQILNVLTKNKNAGALWNAMHEVFPNLRFGLDVESHLAILNAGHLSTVCGKLEGLDKAAANWSISKSDAPEWSSKVTNESDSVKNSTNLRNLRRFRSSDGYRREFLWHARYGDGGRIHIRFARNEFLIEVGYIGPHLPL